MFKSLRTRILAAFALVIFLSIFLSMIIAGWSTSNELDELLYFESEAQAQAFVGPVEVEYNVSRDWDSLPNAFKLFGFGSSVAVGVEQFQLTEAELNDLLREEQAELLQEGVPASERVYFLLDTWIGNREFIFAEDVDIEFSEDFADPIDPSDPPEFFDAEFEDSQLFITDAYLRIRYDSYGELIGEILPEELHEIAAPFKDWETGEIVGYVSVAAGGGFYEDEQSVFLSNVFVTILGGGLLAGLGALGLGALLSRRITAPVTALTEAATKLAASGSAKHLPVHSRDELGQMSLAFNRLTDGLAEQRSLRRRLISDVSHELGTPLSVIQLEAKAMSDGMQSPKEAAQTIQQEVAQLRNLVNDLELIASTDSGILTLTQAPTDIAQFLQDVVSRWQGRAQAGEVELSAVAAPSLPLISADTTRLHQILSNLLKNALSYTPAAGSIKVGADQMTLPDKAGLWVVISVADSGEGISAENLPHLFDRFYRVDDARQRQSGGRGLGLAIVKQLTELHGGHVWATSQLEQGSTFYIALPISEKAPA